MVAYQWNPEEQIYDLTFCYNYIVVKEITASISVATMQSMLEFNSATESKLRQCPFLVLSDGNEIMAVSSNGDKSAFVWDEHPVVPANAHVEEDWLLANTCAAMMTYIMQPSGFIFQSSEVILCSTMCLPLRMPREDVAYYTKCRRGHIEKQLANCRLLLQNYNSLIIYSADTFKLMKSFNRH